MALKILASDILEILADNSGDALKILADDCDVVPFPGPDPGSSDPLTFELSGVSMCGPFFDETYGDTLTPFDGNGCGQGINDWPRPIYGPIIGNPPGSWYSGSPWCETDCMFNGEPGCDSYASVRDSGSFDPGNFFFNAAKYDPDTGLWAVYAGNQTGGAIFIPCSVIDSGVNFFVVTNALTAATCGPPAVIDPTGLIGGDRVPIAYGGTARISW